MTYTRQNHRRDGSVYLAVLSTALIVSLLALSALSLQRLQNRSLTTAADIRQAELNAETAIELGLLDMKQTSNWRTARSNGTWFTARGTGAGTCTLQVTDPLDGDLTDDANEPVQMLGIGYSGAAEQRVTWTVDPKNKPLDCLRSAVAASDGVSLTGSVLRATNSGLVTANSTSASSSTLYGTVQAVTVSGATYSGTNTQISASQLPTMPDWTSVFNYYKTNGTQIDINSLPTATTNNFGRNTGVGIVPSAAGTDWIGNPPDLATATVSQSTNESHSGSHSLRVQSRATYQAGTAQRLDSLVVPGQQLVIEAWVRFNSGVAKNFTVSLYLKGVGGTAQSVTSSNKLAFNGTFGGGDDGNGWYFISKTLTAPTWTGNLEYAYFVIAGDSSNTADFYVDDLAIRENLTGSLIYQRAIGPGVNPFGTANAQGIYWINCNNNKLVIDRSRIRGTLLVINPGTGSCIGPGPVRWTPYVSGYPALLVDADTAANANIAITVTNHTLKESLSGVNFNPTGCPSDDLGTDSDTSDIFPSEIQGIIAVEGDLTYQAPCNALVTGQIIVGDDVIATGGTLEVVYRSDSLLNPPPGFTSATYSFVRRTYSIRKAVNP